MDPSALHEIAAVLKGFLFDAFVFHKASSEPI